MKISRKPHPAEEGDERIIDSLTEGRTFVEQRLTLPAWRLGGGGVKRW